MAAAEEQSAQESRLNGADVPTACLCGSQDLLLQAFLHVEAGRARPEPVEVEGLTCPECGREYEAIIAEDGRILRGDFTGQADLED